MDIESRIRAEQAALRQTIATLRAEADSERARAEKAEAERDEVGSLIANLKRSRAKYPLNRRMFDGLMGEIDELRRAYGGDGDITAEALDVAVCALRIALEGDAGGNERLIDSERARAEKYLAAMTDLTEGHDLGETSFLDAMRAFRALVEEARRG